MFQVVRQAFRSAIHGPHGDRGAATVTLDDAAPTTATRRIRAAVATAVSLALLGVILWRLQAAGWDRTLALLHNGPGFWTALLLFYFTLPAGEWLIYRRLWQLPAAGIVPLLRKRISNEMLFGYSGELYFYLWAKARPDLTRAPFGAVKDVNLTSALSAAALTLGLLAAAAPWFGTLDLGRLGKPLLWSGLLLTAISLGVVAFGRRAFTLGRADLLSITAVHLMRLLTTTLLLALVWHLALPAVALSTWLLLSTARLLIGRLPLVPNTDLVFATLTGVLVGPYNVIGDLLAATTLLILCLHVAVLAALALVDIVRARAKVAPK